MDSYSRMISWLKIILPMCALAILSTLFLYSKSNNPLANLPFAKSEIKQRLNGQNITKPVFSGSTADGDQILLFAAKISHDPESGDTKVEDFTLELDRTSGAQIRFGAAHANLNISEDFISTSGDTVLNTSNGYEIRTESLRARLTSVNIISQNQITASSPLGEIKAGNMRITTEQETKNTQVIFNQEVNVIYNPKTK